MGNLFVSGFLTILSYISLKTALYLEEKELVVISGIATGFNISIFLACLMNLF